MIGHSTTGQHPLAASNSPPDTPPMPQRNIFRINLPYGGRKSVLVADLEVTVRSVLEPIFLQRNLVLDDYIAMREDGASIDFNAKLNTIGAPLELTLTRAGDFLTVYLPHGGKKSMILNPTHTLRFELEKVCIHRNLSLDNLIITGSNGKPCDLDITLAYMSDRSITLNLIVPDECLSKADSLRNSKRKSFLPQIHQTSSKKRVPEDDVISPRELIEATLMARRKTTSYKYKEKPLRRVPTTSSSSNKTGSESEGSDEVGPITEPPALPTTNSGMIPVIDKIEMLASQEKLNVPPSITNNNGNTIINTNTNPNTNNTVNTPIIPPPEPEKTQQQLILESLYEPEFKGYPFPVFQVPLEKLSTPGQPVHYIIRTIIRFLITDEALLTEGIFRIPGSKEEIQNYTKLFDEGKEVNFSTIKNCSHHDVAGLLKEFLRKLPEPLIPFIYNQQVKASMDEHKDNQMDEQELLSSIKSILEQLPTENYNILKLLIKYLSIVMKFSDINKMNIENIIKCIVPTVQCIPAIFNYTILHCDFFFLEQFTTEVDKRGRGRREPAGKFRYHKGRNNQNNKSPTDHPPEGDPAPAGESSHPPFEKSPPPPAKPLPAIPETTIVDIPM